MTIDQPSASSYVYLYTKLHHTGLFRHVHDNGDDNNRTNYFTPAYVHKVKRNLLAIFQPTNLIIIHPKEGLPYLWAFFYKLGSTYKIETYLKVQI